MTFLQKFRQANAELPPPALGEQRVVFMGNSITEGWAPYFPKMFPGKPYVGRGIGGQTTPQMLVRFRQGRHCHVEAGGGRDPGGHQRHRR
ncbi:MAG: hypothetical protein U0163_04455 [Gemmatimonadaceae bacterium]